MKRKRRAISVIVCVFCVISLFIPSSALSAEGEGAQLSASEYVNASSAEPNITRYIPYPHSSDDMEKAHTIHWARGIIPPTMPGQIMEDGSIKGMKEADFTMIDTLDNPVTPDSNTSQFGYYITDYKPGKGWYDVNKNHFFAPERHINDENACYAAAASNVISWWIDRNRGNIESYLKLVNDPSVELMRHDGLADPAVLQKYLDSQAEGFPTNDPKWSMPYDLLLKGFHSIGNFGGGYIHSAMDPFFNGYMPKVLEGPNRPDSFTPFSEGGFFYPVFGLSTLTFESWYTRYDALNTAFKGYFDEGYGIAIGYQHLGGAHAVSVWGAEYDENDNLCGIYITDSNDAGDVRTNYRDWDRNQRIGAMKRYDCYENNYGTTSINTERIINPGKGSVLHSVCLLDTADEEWAYFLEKHVPMYADNRPLVTNDDYINPSAGRKPEVSEPSWSFSAVNQPSAFGKGDIKFDFNVKNSGGRAGSKLIVAGYDSNGRQLECRIVYVEAEKSSVEKSVILNNRSGKICSVNAFLVNENSVPVAETVNIRNNAA